MRAIFLMMAMLWAASCGHAPTATDPAYAKDVETWRAEREARLKKDDGWLTLVGLFWLNEGVSKVGSDPASDVPLPPSTPAHVGTLSRKGSEVGFTPAPGVPLKAAVLQDDEQPNYAPLTLGSVRFYLIHRGERYGIRVKDSQSPARANFTGLDWYAVDPTWKVTATLTPAPHQVTFDTEVGLQQHGDSPGYLEFDRAGVHYKLDATAEDGELSLVIRDSTSGKTTYAASRFVDAALPDAQGHTVLDFNKAYNPPCVFTPYATCPLPPQMNRLTTPIEAGEKKYPGATR